MDFGTLLHSIRRRHRRDIHEVSLETDIPVERLMALENGNTSTPPTALEMTEFRDVFDRMSLDESTQLNCAALNYEQQLSL